MELLQPLVGPTDQPAARIAAGSKAMTAKARPPGICWHCCCCTAAMMMDAQQHVVWVGLGHSWAIAEQPPLSAARHLVLPAATAVLATPVYPSQTLNPPTTNYCGTIEFFYI